MNQVTHDSTAECTMNLGQARLISSINYLLGHDERLIYFFFNHKEPRLRLGVDELLDEARGLSHSECLLIQAAIDFWNGEGGLKIGTALDVWDDQYVMAFVRGLLRLREIEISDFLEDELSC